MVLVLVLDFHLGLGVVWFCQAYEVWSGVVELCCHPSVGVGVKGMVFVVWWGVLVRPPQLGCIEGVLGLPPRCGCRGGVSGICDVVGVC